MGTVTGGSGRQTAAEATCLPTTSANQSTHEQVLLSGGNVGAICKRMKQTSAGTHFGAPALLLWLGLNVRTSDFAADSSRQT